VDERGQLELPEHDLDPGDPVTSIALISLEGVLANGDDLRSAAVHRWTRPLYDGIRSQFRTVALTASDQTIARGWLTRENLHGWTAVMSSSLSIMSYGDWKIDQIREFQANGWEIAFLLDVDQAVTVVAQSMGVLTLTIGLPLHWPGWKADDTSIRPWNEISDTVETP